jgi:hypothetical protein
MYQPDNAHTIRRESEIDLALKSFGIAPAPMPQKPHVVKIRTRARTVLLVCGAALVVLIYIGVPLAAAIHRYLFPVAQDITLVVAIAIQIALFMIFIVMKTDGR